MTARGSSPGGNCSPHRTGARVDASRNGWAIATLIMRVCQDIAQSKHLDERISMSNPASPALKPTDLRLSDYRPVGRSAPETSSHVPPCRASTCTTTSVAG